MKVENIKNENGNAIPNQFIMTEEGRGALGNFNRRETFQSYNSIIAVITYWDGEPGRVEIDENKWDYSQTTGKYRNQFLGETKKETEKKIKSGEYKLVNLNK
ncbi:MAG TPA: hypothetical protein VMV36_01555 [Ignavibacteriaceae bacterium]|nr:hypothetical protein [Ignavibacteriaceae bacterium]